MAKLTKALVQRHAGRPDAYGAALLDIAQDHLLSVIASAGFFDTGELVFKGGTSLRKCRLGPAGRFSTDLDFVAPNEDVVLDVNDILQNRTEADYRPESIGTLTRPIEIPAWEHIVRTRFAFLADLDPDEQQWARCDPRDRRAIEGL